MKAWIMEGEGTVRASITYIRTDSIRVCPTRRWTAVRDYISAKRFGAGVSARNAQRIYKGRKNAQDAHEAIRPTDIAPLPPEKHQGARSPRDQYRLYKLIYSIAISPRQMTPAVYDTLSMDVAGQTAWRSSASTA